MPWEVNELEQLKLFIAWGLTAVVDGIFLIIWAVVQWVVACLIGYIQLTWLDQWVLNTLQSLFAIMTLTPIIANFCVHTTENFVQTRLRIRRELKKLAEEPDSS